MKTSALKSRRPLQNWRKTIRYHSRTASRAEFLDDCIIGVMDKLDLYETYCPDYRMEVLDLADTYGYQL